jgi:2-(1,2-epoxy-1,2-dihydrophenyl)acetyl-CoA isomerase
MVLLAETRERVLTLTLNRPESYNAINIELRDAIVAALRDAEASDIGCIVLRGAGRGFCAGIDLREGAGGRKGPELMDYMRSSTQAIVRAVVTCPVPIVAAVHGVCAGVALVLALGSDLCVGADTARFSMPFVQRALVPDGAMTYLLPRLVGAGRAKRMLLFGEDVAASDAYAFGMIGEIATPEDLDRVVSARAGRLAELPSAALRYTKAMLLRSFELDLESTLFEERAGQALMATTDDYVEGREAFLERRPPHFGGR